MDQITTTTTTTKTSDTENGNPPKSQTNKSLTFSNGTLKKHHHHLHYLTPGLPPPPPAAAVVVVTYKECLKNHAASMGGHAVDGCGEFMPSPTATPTDPTSLKCAACGCHRNFHRREPDYPKTTLTTTHFLDFRNHSLHSPTRGASASASPSPSPPPQPLPPLHYSSAPHMLLALSSALPDDPPAMTHHHPVSTPTAAKAENPSGRKRFRTKFSRDQKEKMFSFSEKLGWKLQKCDEGLIEEFCNEVGIGKSVLKVWMHNNKHTFGKRDSNIITTTTTNSNGQNTNNNGHYHNESSGVHLNLSTDGSSSSS